MNNIHVKVYVTKKMRTPPINAVYGSSGVGIEIEIMDYDLPAGSTAEARATGKFATEVYKNTCTVDGNTITMYPETGFFVPGGNEFQVVITAAGKTILSFVMDVICDKDIGDGNDPSKPEQVLPLVQRAENAAAQSEAAAARAEEVKDSIPEDYTTLSNGVIQLKGDLVKCLKHGGFYSGALNEATEAKWYYSTKTDSTGFPTGTTDTYIFANYPFYRSDGTISFSLQVVLPYENDDKNKKIYFRANNSFEWIEIDGELNEFTFRSYVSGDVNNILNSGWYLGNATEVTNIPPINGYFDLFVYGNKNSSGSIVSSYKILYPHTDSNFVYYRNDNSVVWKSIATTKLGNKRISVIGDSITEKNHTATINWTDWLGYSGAIVQNLGISGTGFWNGVSENLNYINRISQIDNPNIIGIAISFNDIGHEEIEIGSATDRTTNGTVLGYAHDFFDTLISEYPTVPICVYSTNEWAGMHGDEWYQTRATQYIDGIKTLCENNAIPFKPIWKSCNLKPWNTSNRNKYFADVTHPNDLGHQLIFNQLLPLFELCCIDE